MELKQYWKVVRRRWWVVVLLTLLTGVGSLALERESGLSYVATLRLIVSLPPEPKAGNYYTYDKYYTWLSSEYLVDDLGEVVKSRAFAQDMKEELGDDSIGIRAIQGERSTKKTHRILTMKIISSNPEGALRAANAAARVIEKKGKEYVAQLGYGDALVRVIDPPAVAIEGGQRGYLNIGLRTGLGFLAGLALVFLLHYLDSTIYDADDVERRLGIRVLGELPPEV